MTTKGKVELGVGVKKPVRTISGVTPLTVVLSPRKCDHGTCTYCPGGDYVPQSYTDKSPAIMRAMKLGYDPYEQVLARLKVLDRMNHPTDKIEIIILGGTFLQYPREYKYNFIKRCFDALNGKDSDNLEEAKLINESADHRCVAMCIENRPDNCSPEDIKEMLDFGCTRVEIGVQMPDDELYEKTNRGHTVKDVIDATKNLKDAGFKLGYHIMPGLPGSNMEKDLKLFRQIFEYDKFRPDQLKLYPCQVVDDSPLGKFHDKIGYKPYTDEQTKEILYKMMKMIPDYCRIMRVMREFPKEKLIEGSEKLGIRKEIEDEFRNKGLKIKEIRMREIGFNKEDLDLEVKIKSIEYNSSDGREFFLEFVNKEDVLFGLLRLRLVGGGVINKKGQSKFNNEVADEINNDERDLTLTKNGKDKIAIVRELHVYGQALNLGKEGEESQHRGLGKLLMKKAEEIANEEGFDKLSVISGVGVREYYRKLGYELEGAYMTKELS